MKLRSRTAAAGLAALGAAGFVALNCAARNHARAMMVFADGGVRTAKPEELSWSRKARVLLTGVNLPRPRGTATPADVGMEFRALRLAGPDGLQLGAWHCPHPHGSDLVLMFHGYGVDKSSLLHEAAALHDLGLAVLLVDFRGGVDSSAADTTVGYREADDVAAAVAYAAGLAPGRLILYGQSMGAAAVLRAIQARGVRPDAVIVEGVFDTMLHTVRNRFRALGLPPFPGAELLVFWGGLRIGANGFRHNPADYARAVACPILFLHGTDDPRARLAEARRVYTAVPAAKCFREFPGTGHESILKRHPGQWRASVREFLAAPENQAWQAGAGDPGSADTVILLHGLGRTTRSLRKMERQLAAAGFRVINLGYPSTRAPIETLAEKHLAAALAAREFGKGQIHFITHSLGGILLAYYLQNHPLPALGRVVMLCPPARGSELADRFRNNWFYRLLTGPAGRQVGTDPASLPDSLQPVQFELGIIAGNRTLNPFYSRLIPGEDDGKVAVARAKLEGAKDFLVVPRSHTFIMRNQEVISQAMHFLNNGCFRSKTRPPAAAS